MPALHDRFVALHFEADRAKAGREFEPLLDDQFTAWEMAPSRSYRVTGEEIDNSFVVDGATYLLEAKWIAGKTEAAALYAFRQKLASKSAYTRGLFVAVEGFTAGSIDALGASPNGLGDSFGALREGDDLPGGLQPDQALGEGLDGDQLRLEAIECQAGVSK